MALLDAPSIVCAVDGPAGSSELVRIAAELAELVGARLDVVHVMGTHAAGAMAVPASVAVGADETELHATAMLDELCVAAGVTTAIRHVVPYGDPARRVATIAAERGALLIIVGTRADQGRRDGLIGSVSSRLAADAPCPVLVVPPRLERHVRPLGWRGRTLVTGFDGSIASWGAARHAATLAGLLEGGLSVVSVGTDAPHADVVDGLRTAVQDVRYEHRAGDPAWELERVAAAITAPLIAIGSRGLGPWEEALLGSVARRLLRTARRPVLVLPAASLLQARPA
jgi:nucleotide-binding universal stress UspA family protein